MGNLYSNKVLLLRQAVKQLDGVVSLLERVADLEKLQGDKKYADEVYGHYANALEELQYDIGMELEAVQAMVDLGNAAPTDEDEAAAARDEDAKIWRKGDQLVFINNERISGVVADTYEKDGEQYVYLDTGDGELPLKSSSLKRSSFRLK